MVDDARAADQKVQGEDSIVTPHVARDVRLL